MLTNALNNLVDINKLQYKHICGVPYTTVPFATLLAIKQKKSILIHGKENKSHETENLIDGKFVRGDSCLVIASDSSIFETINDLRSEGTDICMVK